VEGLPLFGQTSAVSLSKSSTGNAGTVVNMIPVILLKATDTLIAYSTPGIIKIITKSLSPSRAYIFSILPLNWFIRFSAAFVRFGLIPFIASDEYLPNMKNVAVIIPPF
jgi:hypothetical protein